MKQSIQTKNSLNKTIVLLKKRFFVWLRTIFNIVHNSQEMQKIINHQNQELNEMRLLVNFLLKNTNRYIRRRWIRYLDAAQEVGIWDAEIVKLCPNDKKPTGVDLSKYLDQTKESNIRLSELEKDSMLLDERKYGPISINNTMIL
jgi:hypothetical protein